MQGVITRLHRDVSLSSYLCLRPLSKGRWPIKFEGGRLLLDMLLQLAIELDDLHMDLQL